ncbi:hypothetical protein BJX99DRAFT_242004 [Aspergillus californicus]
MEEFNCSEIVASLGLALYVLGLSPRVSELVDRRCWVFRHARFLETTVLSVFWACSATMALQSVQSSLATPFQRKIGIGVRGNCYG